MAQLSRFASCLAVHWYLQFREVLQGKRKRFVDSLKKSMLRYLPWLHKHIRPERPHGIEGIQALGHREYVGGLWEELGQLQFDFLIEKGLAPHHYLLDIACGSLRAGVHFIRYLEPGHYMGIDKEAELIHAGLEHELGQEIRARKKPQFLVSASFEFEKFTARPDYALAQSLFTHLPPHLIQQCFRKLKKVIADEGVFYATFFEGERSRPNPRHPHDQARFVYNRQEIEAFGVENGWTSNYIGDWQHPRKQVIVEYGPLLRPGWR